MFIIYIKKRRQITTAQAGDVTLRFEKNGSLTNVVVREEEENNLPQMKKLFFLYVWLSERN